MNENWLTSTVASLCNEMRESGDYSLLPLVGDALLDADCSDEELVAACHNREQSDVMRQRVVCLVLGGEYAAAVRWLENAVSEIGYDYDEDDEPYRRVNYETLVAAGREAIADGGYCFGTTSGSEFFYSDSNKHEFFRSLAIVTGTVPPTIETQDSIYFRCAC